MQITVLCDVTPCSLCTPRRVVLCSW